MKHFVGGFALGFIVSLRVIPMNKPYTSMGDYEFSMHMLAHLLVATLFGFVAWGLIP